MDKQKLKPLTPLDRIFDNLRFVKNFEYHAPFSIDDTLDHIYQLAHPAEDIAVTYHIESEPVDDHYLIDISYGRSEAIHHTKLIGTIEPVEDRTKFTGSIRFTNNAVFELLFWFGLGIISALLTTNFGELTFGIFGLATIAQALTIAHLFNERNLLLRRLHDVITAPSPKIKSKIAQSAQYVDEPDFILLADDDTLAERYDEQ